MPTDTKYKAMYKYELAQAAGVSHTTFRKWLVQMSVQLAEMGVNRNTKLLPPNAVQLLCERYCIIP